MPIRQFAGIENQDFLPNELYALYQTEYGMSIFNARERISAVIANQRDAKYIGVESGVPLLLIEREAISIDGRCIELRTNRCNTYSLRCDITLE